MDLQSRSSNLHRVGLVAIGRNEGERLRDCLRSAIAERIQALVYVDSGSTDGSAELARSLGVEVVALDLSRPFTAARARNAGFARLREIDPELDYVQFVDGDMKIVSGWVQAACETLDAHPEIVAVCGWRRELHADQSVYNRICAVEWMSGSAGSIQSFGGDIMIRAAAFADVGGYNQQIIAAEDDELSIRLRREHGQLWRLDHDSTWHDANMHTFAQWWKRAKRCGHAYAQVASLHGAGPERKFIRELRRCLLWGALLPFLALVLAWPTKGWSLLLLLRYPLTFVRTFFRTRKKGFSSSESLAWALSCMVSAFPEATGAIRFFFDRLRNRSSELIEYKTATGFKAQA